jgi:hypothetical protein
MLAAMDSGPAIFMSSGARLYQNIESMLRIVRLTMTELYRHEYTLAVVDFQLCPVERLAVKSSSNDSSRRGTVGAEVG